MDITENSGPNWQVSGRHARSFHLLKEYVFHRSAQLWRWIGGRAGFHVGPGFQPARE